MRRYVVALALLLFAGFVLTSSGQVQESSNESRRVVQRVSPLYPSVAKRMNLAGTVKLVSRRTGRQSENCGIGRWKPPPDSGSERRRHEVEVCSGRLRIARIGGIPFQSTRP